MNIASCNSFLTNRKGQFLHSPLEIILIDNITNAMCFSESIHAAYQFLVKHNSYIVALKHGAIL